MLSLLRRVCGAFVALVAGLGTASADPVADFYRGKTINMILSPGEGGGFAGYAHAFVPYLRAHIPGQPNIVIQNMPGAGGIRAMLYFQNVAPKDGTAIGFVHGSVPLAPLLDLPGAKFDPLAMNWIGSLNYSKAVCIAWHTSPIKTWQDVFDKEFTIGGTGAGATMETIPAVLNKFFGTRIKVVSGYKGGNDIDLAMERGEVDGRCVLPIASVNLTRPDWIPQKKVTVPIVLGFERIPEFPDTPAIGEFATEERQKQILRLEFAPQGMERPFVLPAGVPPERVAALREAFHSAINDPAFQADVVKMGLEIKEVPGEKLEKLLRDIYASPPEIVKAASEAAKVHSSSHPE